LILRGYETNQFCKENFLRTAKLFVEFGTLLRTILDKKEGHIKYLSPAIQLFRGQGYEGANVLQ